MLNLRDYLIMEVENQGKVKRVDVSDETSHIVYEPQSTLELKELGRIKEDEKE